MERTIILRDAQGEIVAKSAYRARDGPSLDGPPNRRFPRHHDLTIFTGAHILIFKAKLPNSGHMGDVGLGPFLRRMK